MPLYDGMEAKDLATFHIQTMILYSIMGKEGKIRLEDV